jgi:hypothetical protein
MWLTFRPIALFFMQSGPSGKGSPLGDLIPNLGEESNDVAAVVIHHCCLGLG